MKLKTIGRNARPAARVRRHRASRAAKAGRPPAPESQQQRVWSLLLPPGYPSERR